MVCYLSGLGAGGEGEGVVLGVGELLKVEVGEGGGGGGLRYKEVVIRGREGWWEKDKSFLRVRCWNCVVERGTVTSMIPQAMD